MPDKAGQTCLHVAAASGHYDMVQVLLGQGSDYNTVDKVSLEVVNAHWGRRIGTFLPQLLSEEQAKFKRPVAKEPSTYDFRVHIGWGVHQKHGVIEVG